MTAAGECGGAASPRIVIVVLIFDDTFSGGVSGHKGILVHTEIYTIFLQIGSAVGEGFHVIMPFAHEHHRNPSHNEGKNQRLSLIHIWELSPGIMGRSFPSRR